MPTRTPRPPSPTAGTGYDAHGFQQEPVYEDAAGGDFTLVSGSPLLDVGVVIPGINDRFHVNGPDLGAFERDGLSPGPDDGGVPWPDGGATPWPDAGPRPDGGGEPGAGDDGGCGCRAGTERPGAPGALLLVLLGWLLTRRRRDRE